MSFDPTSPDFDPEAALGHPESVILPNPSVLPYNNVAEYVSRTRGLGRARGPRPATLLSQRAAGRGNTSQATTSKADDRRTRLESTLTKKPETKDLKDVLNLMPTKSGPLAFLHKCITNRTKVKVWTRNFTHIRGICTGYLVVFDKHWNLAMKDVDETYVRPVKRKTPHMGPLLTTQDNRNVVIPTTSSNEDSSDNFVPKGKWCKRHVPQLFIRGDNVVMVATVT